MTSLEQYLVWWAYGAILITAGLGSISIGTAAMEQPPLAIVLGLGTFSVVSIVTGAVVHTAIGLLR